MTGQMSDRAFRQALRRTDGGVLLALEAHPDADEDAFPSGYNAWRARIGIRVTAPPAEGRANAAIVRIVAEYFALGTRSVTLHAGATSTRKTVLVAGAELEAVARRLEADL